MVAEPDFCFDLVSDVDVELASAVMPLLVGLLLFITAPIRVAEMDVCSVRVGPGVFI